LGGCLDIQHASLVSWYYQRYGHDGPLPILNTIHRHTRPTDFIDTHPTYIHAAGVANTPESLHQGVSIGSPEDDVDWPNWLTHLRREAEERMIPVIIELENGHQPDVWPSCQASAQYLTKVR
jgi:hypothetical protein